MTDPTRDPRSVSATVGESPSTLGPLWVAVASAVFVSAVLAWWVAHAGLQAVFGPIDDHEPLFWMGADGRLGIGEYLNTLLNSTEVGDWPSTARFRPVYYAIRVGQALILSDDPRSWYASVIVAYAVTCVLAGVTFAVAIDWAGRWERSLSRVTAFVFAGGVGAATLAGLGAWSGIVPRLGPAELPALLLTMTALLGAVMLGRTGRRWWWAALLVGAMGAALSKESFVLVPLIAVLTGIYRYFQFGRWVWDLVLGTLALIPLGLLAPVLLGIQQDVNGEAGGAARLMPGLIALRWVFVSYWLPATAALLISFGVWWWCCGRGRVLVSAYVLGVSLWSIVLLWGDVVFYGGEYPHQRYWAVFDLAKTLQIMGAVVLALAAARRSKGTARVVSACALVLAIGLMSRLGLAAAEEYGAIRAEAVVNRDATQQYARDLQMAAAMLAEKPGSQFVVVAPSNVEFEPSRAIATHIAREAGSSHPVFLVVDIPAEQDGGRTGQGLKDLALAGAFEWSLTPLGELRSDEPVVCGFVNVDPYPVQGCRDENSLRINARGM